MCLMNASAPTVEPSLAEAEQFEQVRRKIELAIPIYKRATACGNPHLRAVAWQRLAECYRKTASGTTLCRHIGSSSNIRSRKSVL